MARPGPSLPAADDLRARIDPQGRLAVKVTPGAREEAVTLVGAAVLVKVRAPADKGAANEAVAGLLASALGIPRSRLALLRGATSRQKLFRVET
ncbi:DUF167 domain-containing protein [Erythrobacter sp. sf7]|uniref:UPF0235 protein OIK40_03675 n=1 Tax=Erythrobacter fulvus TaxID=2987523 RepID=A0ABT5JM94_9SPHN|nr:DUF167 domain-containing protein [Erythrobacter fulvus]MDC8753738.1 DUF167 domain-containing protein [Erythrobacter fulvus]